MYTQVTSLNPTYSNYRDKKVKFNPKISWPNLKTYNLGVILDKLSGSLSEVSGLND